jgi:hypothetical protein
MIIRKFAILLVVAATLTGCATVKNWMGIGGRSDDTVLPGQREDVLPPQQLPRGNRAGKIDAPDAPCDPSDPNYPECLTPDSPAGSASSAVDEESATPQQ